MNKPKTVTPYNKLETLLQVMLKDLADSKRLNASIKALAPEPGAALRREVDLSIHSATIVSALFWPPVAAEQLVLPGKVSPDAMLIRIRPVR